MTVGADFHATTQSDDDDYGCTSLRTAELYPFGTLSETMFEHGGIEYTVVQLSHTGTSESPRLVFGIEPFARAGGTGAWVARYRHETDVEEDSVADAGERFVFALQGAGGTPAGLGGTAADDLGVLGGRRGSATWTPALPGLRRPEPSGWTWGDDAMSRRARGSASGAGCDGRPWSGLRRPRTGFMKHNRLYGELFANDGFQWSVCDSTVPPRMSTPLHALLFPAATALRCR